MESSYDETNFSMLVPIVLVKLHHLLIWFSKPLEPLNSTLTFYSDILNFTSCLKWNLYKNSAQHFDLSSRMNELELKMDWMVR